jgi:hypothetical protein
MNMKNALIVLSAVAASLAAAIALKKAAPTVHGMIF